VSRLAVNTGPHLHLVVAELEQRRALGGRGARGQRHAHGPGDGIDFVADPQQFVQVRTLLRGGPDRLDHEEVAGDTTPARGVCGVLHRDVVVDQQGAEKEIGKGRIKTQPGRFSIAGEGLNVGKDGAEPVTDDYPGDAPWRFTGGTIMRAAVDVSGEPFVDLAAGARMAFMRD
jgi:hypothetical protein